MLLPALIPGELITAAAVLFLLFGVPAILFGVLMLYTGYVRYDAEQYLEELDAEAEAEAGAEAEGDADTKATPTIDDANQEPDARPAPIDDANQEPDARPAPIDDASQEGNGERNARNDSFDRESTPNADVDDR